MNKVFRTIGFSAALSMVGVLATGLAGCGRSASGSAEPADAAYTAKLNAYTQAHNTLLGDAGMQLAEDNYLGPGPRALVSDKLGFDLEPVAQSLAQARDQLKAARALPGSSMGDADRAADTLIAAINKATAKLSEVNAYYSSQGYKQDGLARGKREDGPIVAVLSEADVAMQRFNSLIEADLQHQTLADIARLKAKGDLLDYDVKLGINQARSAIELFKRPENVTDAARFRQADALVASLQRTLADLRTRIEAAKRDRKPSEGEVSPYYDGAANSLLSLTGYFHNFEQRRDKASYDTMLTAFNTAVNDSNDLTRYR